MHEPSKATPSSALHVAEWFSTDNWRDLEIDGEVAIRSIDRLLRRRSVMDARFFPLFDGEKLDRVHLAFLTDRTICHIYLANRKIVFNEYLLEHISCTLEIGFLEPKSGAVRPLSFVSLKTNTQSRDEVFWFAIPPELQSQAVSFVSRINEMRSGGRREQIITRSSKPDTSLSDDSLFHVANETIYLRPNIFGFGIDLNALIKRLFGRK